MNKRKRKNPLKKVIYLIDQDTYDKIMIMSREDRRSYSSMVEWLIDMEFKKRYLT